MAAGSTQFRVRQIAVGTFVKPPCRNEVKDNSSRRARSPPDRLHDTAQITASPCVRSSRAGACATSDVRGRGETRDREMVLFLIASSSAINSGKQRVARLIEQRPPCFFAVLGVHDADTVRSLLWPIVRNLKGAKTCSSRCSHSQVTSAVVATDRWTPRSRRSCSSTASHWLRCRIAPKCGGPANRSACKAVFEYVIQSWQRVMPRWGATHLAAPRSSRIEIMLR